MLMRTTVTRNIIAGIFLANALIFTMLVVHPQPSHVRHAEETSTAFERRTIEEYDRFTDRNARISLALSLASFALILCRVGRALGTLLVSCGAYLAAYALFANRGHAFYASYSTGPRSPFIDGVLAVILVVAGILLAGGFAKERMGAILRFER